MKFRVLKTFKRKGETQTPGTIIEIARMTVATLAQMDGYIEPVPEQDGHYCQSGGCHCSEKLPGSDYPASCIKNHCEYHNTKTEEL